MPLWACLWPVHGSKGLSTQEYGRIPNRLLRSQSSHGFGAVERMVIQYKRLLIPRPPTPSIKVLGLPFVFSLGCNFYDRHVLPHVLYEQADRNYNVDQKLRTRTSERFNPIENGDRHCRMLNSISLVEGDGFSTCQQVYSHYYRIFRIPPAFFTEFFVSGLAFCLRRNRVNDAILFTSLTATAQYLQESFL